MEILLIRHAYPDYENDTLTENGHEEAKLLAERLRRVRLDKIYASPAGRAQATGRPTAAMKGISMTTLPWLQEVSLVPGIDPWNHPAADVLQRPRVPALETWPEEVSYGKAYQPAHAAVASAFDEVMAAHGYRREGRLYRVHRPSMERLAFFAHNGLIRMLLSHLLNWAFPTLILSCHISPSGLTQLRFREKNGTAVPELRSFNDVSHLDSRRKPADQDESLPLSFYS